MICNPRLHPPWDSLATFKWSHGARLFCQELLSKDEAHRPSAAEALRDPWLSKSCALHSGKPSTSVKPHDREGLHLPHLQSHLMKVARSCMTSQLNLSQLHQMNTRFKLC